MKTKTIAFLTGILLLFVIATQSLQAQTLSSQKRATVYTTRFTEAKLAMSQYIQARAVQIQKKEEMPTRFHAEFVLEEKHLMEFDSVISRLGWISENVLTMQNEQPQIRKLAETIAETEAQLTDLKAQADQPDLKFAQREVLRTELIQLEASLKHQRQELRDLLEREGLAFVTLNVFDEMTTPTKTGSEIAFVNMPGVEFGFMQVENPQYGLSSDYYQGYTIKYLFTRGKSYVDLGVYKAGTNNTEDTSRIKELFMINFGQDFYPRHFGRGHRKFFNLYSCYQVGGLIATQNNEENTRFIPNLNVGLGVELVKTKHILLDNKITYMLPLHYTNRNLRSVLYNASFNFVF